MINLSKTPNETPKPIPKPKSKFVLIVVLAVAWTFVVVFYGKYSDGRFLDKSLAEAIVEAKQVSAKPISSERLAFVGAVNDASLDNALTKAEWRIIKQKRAVYKAAELKNYK